MDSIEENDDSDQEQGGYGRPPKEYQFQPGKSGNPRGRPKKSSETDPDKVLNQLLNEQMTVHIKGKKINISMKEAILRSTLKDALSGNNTARKIVLELMRKQVSPEAFEFNPEDEHALREIMKQLPNQDKETDDESKNKSG